MRRRQIKDNTVLFRLPSSMRDDMDAAVIALNGRNGAELTTSSFVRQCIGYVLLQISDSVVAQARLRGVQ